MSSTIGSATLTVKVTESISLNGSEQGATNTMTISSVNEISKRIVSVPQSEVTLLNFCRRRCKIH
mgnify:CR=1 FL=1